MVCYLIHYCNNWIFDIYFLARLWVQLIFGLILCMLVYRILNSTLRYKNLCRYYYRLFSGLEPLSTFEKDRAWHISEDLDILAMKVDYLTTSKLKSSNTFFSKNCFPCRKHVQSLLGLMISALLGLLVVRFFFIHHLLILASTFFII